ncbi:MAG: hypothetical protein NC548_55015 [Lachnospiraceae bacterium]|nr:hypothetical protein [Lachnospiraceae bacterium]
MRLVIKGRVYNFQNGYSLKVTNLGNGIGINLTNGAGFTVMSTRLGIKVTERMGIIREVEKLSKLQLKIKEDCLVYQCPEVNQMNGEESDIIVEPVGEDKVNISILKGIVDDASGTVVLKTCNTSFMSYKGIEEEVTNIVTKEIKQSRQKALILPYYGGVVLYERIFQASDKKHVARCILNDYDIKGNRVTCHGVIIEIGVLDGDPVASETCRDINIYDRNRAINEIQKHLKQLGLNIVGELSIYRDNTDTEFKVNIAQNGIKVTKVEREDYNGEKLPTFKALEAASPVEIKYTDYAGISKYILNKYVQGQQRQQQTNQRSQAPQRNASQRSTPQRNSQVQKQRRSAMDTMIDSILGLMIFKRAIRRLSKLFGLK